MQAAINGTTLCLNKTECANTPGSYECVCAPGYRLIVGTGTCQRMHKESTIPRVHIKIESAKPHVGILPYEYMNNVTNQCMATDHFFEK